MSTLSLPQVSQQGNPAQSSLSVNTYEIQKSSYAILQNQKQPTTLQENLSSQPSTGVVEQQVSTAQIIPQREGKGIKFNVEEACMQFVLLCAENERLSFSYIQKEKEVNQLANQVENLSRINSSKNQASNSSSNQLGQGLEIQAHHDFKSANLERDLECTKIQISSLIEQVSLLKKQLFDANELTQKQASQVAKVDYLQLQISHYSLELAERDQNQLQSSKEIKELKQYIEILEGEVDTIRKQFSESQSSQLKVTNKYEQIQAEISQQSNLNHKTLEEYEQAINKTQGQCELLLEENSKLSQALLLRISENEALREEIQIQGRVQANNEETQYMIEELRVNVDQLLADNNRLCEANRTFSQQQDESRKDKNEQLERERKLKSQINDLEQQLGTIGKQIQIRNQDNSESEIRSRNAERSAKELIFEVEKLRSSIEIKEIQLKELHQQVEDMKGESTKLQSLRKEYGLIIARCSEVEKQLLVSQDETNGWKVKFSSIESLQVQILEDAKLKVRRECMQDSERESTWLKARLEGVEQQRDQLMQKLSQSENRASISDQQAKEWSNQLQILNEDMDIVKKENNDKRHRLEAAEKLVFNLQEKILLIRIENERLHQILSKLQLQHEDCKRQLEQTLHSSKKSHSEVVQRFQEYEDVSRNLKLMISDYQDQISKLEKNNQILRQGNFKIDELDNKIAFITREYDNIKLKLIESESQKQDLKLKAQDLQNQVIQYSQIDQQLSYLTKENDRLQKIILERCRASGPLW